MGEPRGEAEKAFNTQKLALADRIRHDGRLSGSLRMVGAEICSLTNFKTGYAWAPEKYLAEKLGLAHRTIKMAIAALKAAGYIEVRKVGRNNRYVPIFAAVEKGQNLPLSKTEQGQNTPLSDADRGKIRPEQGQKTTADRGKKVPPISLGTSLGISSPAEAGAVGAAPDGAAGPSFDLGLPGVALMERLGGDVFRSWLGKVAVVSIGPDELVLQAPSQFVASYIANNFEGPVLAAWRVQQPGLSKLSLVVAPTPISRKKPENPDARWLVDVGIGIVIDRLHEPRAAAERTILAWLKRCGNDAAGLRRIIAETAALDVVETEDQFRNIVKQRTKALLFAGQQPMQFMLGPQAVKRSAS